jgi:hypothetical protein
MWFSWHEPCLVLYHPSKPGSAPSPLNWGLDGCNTQLKKNLISYPKTVGFGFKSVFLSSRFEAWLQTMVFNSDNKREMSVRPQILRQYVTSPRASAPSSLFRKYHAVHAIWHLRKCRGTVALLAWHPHDFTDFTATRRREVVETWRPSGLGKSSQNRINN